MRRFVQHQGKPRSCIARSAESHLQMLYRAWMQESRHAKYIFLHRVSREGNCDADTDRGDELPIINNLARGSSSSVDAGNASRSRSNATIWETWRSMVEMAYSMILCTLQPDTLQSIFKVDDLPVPHVGLNSRLPLLQHAIYRGADGGFGAHCRSKDPAIVKAAHDFLDSARGRATTALAANGYEALTYSVAQGRQDATRHAKSYPGRPDTIEVSFAASAITYVWALSLSTWYVDERKAKTRKQKEKEKSCMAQ
jgi:hypothetical protein